MKAQNIQREPCLPEHLAAIFMDATERTSSAPDDIIALLSQMAMGQDCDLARDATTSLYKQIILPLCDDFSSAGVDIVNRVLITMIQTFCRTNKGRQVRQLLEDLQLTDRESFLTRQRQVSDPQPLSHAQRQAVKKVFILSRVTLGADIAITSLIISQAQKALPNAEIFLVGPDHLRHLFHNAGLHYLDFFYNREGSFQEKMALWPSLFERIGAESQGLAPEEVLLFDSDTRLSQLGLLPLTYTSSTHYLCSRKDNAQHLSLSTITHSWLDHIFPDIPPSSPRFWINPAQIATCQAFASQLPQSTFKIVINFGVGNDDNKRLPSPFEEELLSALLEKKKTLIILDSGRGGAEERAAKRLMAKIAERGYNTAELSESQLGKAAVAFQHGLLRFSGKIDAMAGLIMSSDLFIGYDSCGQHVATATETPAIICFAGAPNKRFAGRWQPGNHHGKTTNFIIGQKPASKEQRAELIGKIVKTAGQYRL